MARLRFLRFVAATLVLLVLAAASRAQSAPVTVYEDAVGYTLDNGIIKALISKSSGDLISMKYNGLEMMATVTNPDGTPDLKTDPPGRNTRGFAPFTDHQYGFWSHDASSPNTTAKLTIDPSTNGGQRAEVSIKGLSNGKPMGAGPGGSFISDIEIRYALGRGESGVYTYCIFEHQPDYGDSSLGEARFCCKLSPVFDWMLVDRHHNMLYTAAMERGDDKYNYTSVQYDHPAFGWASTTKNVGFFFVNASVEYLTGPPTKVEFLCHRDTNQVAAPCVLNYWRSSHYGGASVDVAQGEHWTKVIGPFLLYCNSGGDSQALWKDAIDQVGREKQKWPYSWVNGVDYPHAEQRNTIWGHIVLNDPVKMSHLMVGLSYPDYTIPTARPAATNSPRDIIWQTDAKHYEFWVHGDDDGSFTIPNVRAGDYTLHAFADGVLGEFAEANIHVTPGGTASLGDVVRQAVSGHPTIVHHVVSLGDMAWKPVRFGRQIWEIGIPNRNGSEFAKGDDYFHDGMGLIYAQLFPNDVNYIIGKSDFRQDWFYEQVPHVLPVAATVTPPIVTPPTTQGVGRGRGRGRGGAPAGGRATPWTISFDLPSALTGKATLRLGIATCNTREIDISVNGQEAGKLDRLPTDSAIGRNGIQGIWFERDFPFDAAMLKAGTNQLVLTIPAGGLTNGVIYDYLRLEADDGK
jgi:rhamnogalacturonan endolyase